jgi:hypothetical protein
VGECRYFYLFFSYSYPCLSHTIYERGELLVLSFLISECVFGEGGFGKKQEDKIGRFVSENLNIVFCPFVI